jgi:hypothetical protein
MSEGKKPALTRITEPDEGLVHYQAPPGMDQVTLCGLTDFIHAKRRGAATWKSVTCQPCRCIVNYIHDHAKPSQP